MANSTAEISVSPATGLALYGLFELFLRQPNAAVAVYAFVAITQIAPQHLPAYDAAAAMVGNYFQEPHADDPSQASKSSGDDNGAQHNPRNPSSPERSQASQSFADYTTLKYDQYRKLVALSKANAWLIGSLTWIPLILFFIHGNYIQAHALRQRYFKLILGFAYAAVVAYLAASDRPWEPLYMLIIYWRFEFTGKYAQALITGWSWIEWYTNHSKKRVITSAIIAILIQTPLLVVVISTALGDFMCHCIRDPTYMRARIANATFNAIRLPHSLCLMILQIWLHVNGLAEHFINRWSLVENILIWINTAIGFGGIFYAPDAFVSLVIQSLIFVGSLRYLYKERVARYMTMLRNATSRSIASAVHAIAAFIDSVKGWLIFYAFIVYSIKVPVALNLIPRNHYSVTHLWNSILTFRWPQVNDLITNEDLRNQWSQVKLAVSISLASFLDMRHDAKACFDYVYSYMSWVSPSPRESWEAICSYTLYPVASVFGWVWAMIKTSSTQYITEASAYYGGFASPGESLKFAANQSINASSNALSEDLRSAPSQSNFAFFSALSTYSKKLLNCLATIIGYASQIFEIVFHANSCPRNTTSELFWSKTFVIMSTAIVTCACVAQYKLYAHPTGQRFIIVYYLTVGLGYLYTLECTQDVKAAVCTVLIVSPLPCFMFSPDLIMDSVRRGLHGIIGFSYAIYATVDAACTKVMDAVVGGNGDNDWTGDPQLPAVWFPTNLDTWATDSDDSSDEEDLLAPSSVPSSVLAPATVAVEEQKPVDRTPVAQNSSAQKSKTTAVRVNKARYVRKHKDQRKQKSLERASAATNALVKASREFGPRPVFNESVESSSSIPDETTKNTTTSSPDAVEAEILEQPSSQLEVPTREHPATNGLIAKSSGSALGPVADETIDPSLALPVRTAEFITDSLPTEVETVLLAQPSDQSDIEGIEDAPPESTTQVKPVVNTNIDSNMNDAPEAAAIKMNSTPALAPASQTPGNDFNLGAESFAAAGTLNTNTDDPPESDISSLDSDDLQDTAEGERMLAAAYAARDAAAATASPLSLSVEILEDSDSDLSDPPDKYQ
ncbi:hypothetical protein HBH53_176240 [Parastagonospora nodorum]|nr:hypothetical protein HBH53_176240 [Parastagonospora nodorum]KAH5070153.1 hypothetical protein HBH95_182300 [Parastagonospora nodorum]KAH5097363.1 hypothetical protein HBH72_126580 [Parastagonospora nodorum]KAH5143400.1 hypothetical protein HBH69_194070 [Parastagonospora nodorum]KAH5302119.1 hypothetical protein HBI11_138620 [Parastagonospora nodorum]